MLADSRQASNFVKGPFEGHFPRLFIYLLSSEFLLRFLFLDSTTIWTTYTQHNVISYYTLTPMFWLLFGSKPHFSFCVPAQPQQKSICLLAALYIWSPIAKCSLPFGHRALCWVDVRFRLVWRNLKCHTENWLAANLESSAPALLHLFKSVSEAMEVCCSIFSCFCSKRLQTLTSSHVLFLHFHLLTHLHELSLWK